MKTSAASDFRHDIGPDDLTGSVFRDGDPPVYLLTDGRFAVEIDGKWRIKPSMAGIESSILRLAKAKVLKVFGTDPSPSSRRAFCRLDEAMLVKGHDRLYGVDGHFIKQSFDMKYFLYNEETVKKLQKLQDDFNKAQAAYASAVDKLLTSATTIEHWNFRELLEKHGVTPSKE